jgi:hypothetical protein
VVTDTKRRPEGWRVRHRMGPNWVKVYDKASVLRIETVINCGPLGLGLLPGGVERYVQLGSARAGQHPAAGHVDQGLLRGCRGFTAGLLGRGSVAGRSAFDSWPLRVVAGHQVASFGSEVEWLHGAGGCLATGRLEKANAAAPSLLQPARSMPTMAPERHEPNRYIARVGARVTMSVYRGRGRLRPSGLRGGRTN